MNKKLLIHFNTNKTKIYELNKGKCTFIKEEKLFFNETLVNEEMFNKFIKFFKNLQQNFGSFNNTNTRLYATGIFQELSKEERMQLTIYVYVHFGLLLNIISQEMEEFYIKQSKTKFGFEDPIIGLSCQEFRKVVICGSFQQNMKEIVTLMNELDKRNVEVLSPWTTDVVKETLGTDFILLEGQELFNERDSWRHKYDHMNKFIKADAIIVCNPNGRVGKGTMYEFGFMVAHAKRIIFTNEPIELTIKFPYEIGLNFQ